MNTATEAPIYHKERHTVSWNGHEHPMSTFCFVWSDIRGIEEFLEIYAEKEEREHMPRILQYLVVKSNNLIEYLRWISNEACYEAKEVSCALRHYLLEEDRASKVEVAQRLLKIRRYLGLDALFGTRPEIVFGSPWMQILR